MQALIPRFRCPECEGARSVVLRGEELEIASIEVFDEPVAGSPQGGGEHRCIAPA
jgi:hypothetical protein